MIVAPAGEVRVMTNGAAVCVPCGMRLANAHHARSAAHRMGRWHTGGVAIQREMQGGAVLLLDGGVAALRAAIRAGGGDPSTELRQVGGRPSQTSTGLQPYWWATQDAVVDALEGGRRPLSPAQRAVLALSLAATRDVARSGRPWYLALAEAAAALPDDGGRHLPAWVLYVTGFAVASAYDDANHAG